MHWADVIYFIWLVSIGLQTPAYHVSPLLRPTELEEWQMEVQQLLFHLMALPLQALRVVSYSHPIPQSLLLSLTESFLGKLPFQVVISKV